MGVTERTDRSPAARTESFTRFVRGFEPRLRIALAAAIGQERGAEAAAEALAYGWEHWDRIEEMDNPCGYLYRVGRSRFRAPRPVRLPMVPEVLAPRVEPGLPAALAALSDRQRVAVVLIHGFGWTAGEVAELLGLEVATVATHLRRGLAKLRQSLGVQDDG
jgi:DNA-directed RNA polymerase specialized sigma24 family protein